MIFTFRKEGDNYEGTSMLRTSYKNRYIKDQLYRLDAVKQERQSLGMPIIYPSIDATDEQLELAGDIVEGIRNNEQSGVVMP